jgi:hypothetical protein
MTRVKTLTSGAKNDRTRFKPADVAGADRQSGNTNNRGG